MILKATWQDANQLTEIALLSKAHWGYSKEQIESWREDLSITSDRIRKWNFYKFVDQGEILGFSGLNFVSQQAHLEFLFVTPEFIGCKIGHQLMDHALSQAKKNTCTKMLVLSDPNAQSFYEKYGFVKFKEEESSIPGRFLPWLIKEL